MTCIEPIDVPPQLTHKATVLYIDDDAVNRALINRLLSSYNFKVVEAQTGLEGIAIAKKERPDLILMDINMPGLDGHETTTRMRSIPALDKTPIVALTARTAKGERELALVAGCDGYITKPIEVDNFPHQVIAYLEGQRDTMSGAERQHFLGQYSQKLVERLEAKIIQLEQANQKLHKVDKLKSDFITLAAHELRTPITLIYGYARLLQLTAQESDDNVPPEGSPGDLAGRIFDAVHRLNETINDILNISLIEANQMRLEREPVNLVEVINAAFRELNRTNPQRLLTIGFDHSLTSLPSIIGDPQRLQQVFWNLLSNAIKFTPDGGSISVKGWVVAPGPAETGLSHAFPTSTASGSGVVVTVADTGVGIDLAEQVNIFDRFYIVANTAYHTSSKTAFQGGGLGLGLSITRGIIQAHGGRIWVESPGHDPQGMPGSTFFVFLPFGDSPYAS